MGIHSQDGGVFSAPNPTPVAKISKIFLHLIIIIIIIFIFGSPTVQRSVEWKEIISSLFFPCFSLALLATYWPTSFFLSLFFLLTYFDLLSTRLHMYAKVWAADVNAPPFAFNFVPQSDAKARAFISVYIDLVLFFRSNIPTLAFYLFYHTPLCVSEWRPSSCCSFCIAFAFAVRVQEVL